MNFNLEKFFTGIIDFFAILLPGAIITFFIQGQLGPSLFGEDKPFPGSPDYGFVIFLVIAYILGHFINSIAAKCLDDLYDKRLREKHNKNCDMTLVAAKKLRDKYLSHEELKAQIYEDDIKVKVLYFKRYAKDIGIQRKKDKKKYEEKNSMEDKEIDNFILDLVEKEKNEEGILKEFIMEKTEIEAQEKKKLNEAVKKKLLIEFEKNRGIDIINTFQFSKRVLLLKEPEALEEVNRLEADQKFFRSLVITFFIIGGVLICKFVYHIIIGEVTFSSQWTNLIDTFYGKDKLSLHLINLLLGIVFIFLSWNSLNNFAKLRYKNTELAYYFLITMDNEFGKERGESPEVEAGRS